MSPKNARPSELVAIPARVVVNDRGMRHLAGVHMAYWYLRGEPEAYGWDDLVRDGATEWDGVRNATARINLKAMAKGDHAILYHSVTDKAAVGTVEIVREWRPDGEKGDWASVRIEPRDKFAVPVTLAAIKAEPTLAELTMLRQSRLSVGPVDAAQWKQLLKMGRG